MLPTCCCDHRRCVHAARHPPKRLLCVSALEGGVAKQQRIHQAAKAPNVCSCSGAASAAPCIEQQLWRYVICSTTHSACTPTTITVTVLAVCGRPPRSLQYLLREAKVAEFC